MDQAPAALAALELRQASVVHQLRIQVVAVAARFLQVVAVLVAPVAAVLAARLLLLWPVLQTLAAAAVVVLLVALLVQLAAPAS
jgi:hypothetical protein